VRAIRSRNSELAAPMGTFAPASPSFRRGQALKIPARPRNFFYDPRQNVSCAAELVRLHHGRRDMARHLQFAEVLASGDRRALSDRL
jgi:hypothetical protein